jgi:hypothetical protein
MSLENFIYEFQNMHEIQSFFWQSNEVYQIIFHIVMV